MVQLDLSPLSNGQHCVFSLEHQVYSRFLVAVINHSTPLRRQPLICHHQAQSQTAKNTHHRASNRDSTIDMCHYYIWIWDCCTAVELKFPPDECEFYMNAKALYRRNMRSGLPAPVPKYCVERDANRMTWIHFQPSEWRPCPRSHRAMPPGQSGGS